MFALEYSKAIRIKRREEDIQEANANLKHKGQMLMYTAANCGYDEKGKRKATTANEEEDSEGEGSVDQENLNNEDKNDRGNEKRSKGVFSDTEEYYDVSFLTTTSGGTYQNSVSSNSSH